MPDPYVVRPDSGFLGRILREGGEDVKKCFQCATCSVVCELSRGGRPFPRKEMIWAQWGLKDRLMADPDVWLCHQCSDCSTHCPRGARPADVLAAIRKETILHYAVPGFIARWVNEPRYLPLVLIIPAVLLGLTLLTRDALGGAMGIAPEVVPGEAGEHWEYAHMFPHWLLIGFFMFFSGVAALAAVVGVVRFWSAMRAADARAAGSPPAGSLGASIVRVIKEVFAHQKFKQCTAHQSRYLAHLGVFYGFMGLLIVTLWAVVVLYVFKPLSPETFVYPFAFLNPMKIVANLSTVALIVGCALMIRDRMARSGNQGASTSFDWMFLWLLLAVVLTGVMVEGLRYAELKSLGYTVYFVHLLLVFSLLIYLPYSKFGHVVYRFVALVYADYTGRIRQTGAPAGREAVAGP